MHSSNALSIFRSSAELKEPIRVSGATSSAKALLVARYIQSYSTSQERIAPIIVLCPNDDLANEFCTDLRCIAESLEQMELTIFHFPTWEQSPYSSIQPSIRTRFSRLACLSALLRLKPLDVVVTSIAASCQRTLPRSLFEEVTLALRKGESITSREIFTRHLLESGYLRVDPVEDPGTFAVRGEIVDIFPTDRSAPIRVELFDDEVEQIREFDPSTQRTLESQIQEIRIPPARELLINSRTSEKLLNNFKTYADDTGVHRSIRDPILTSIRAGQYPDHSDTWTPFAYPDHTTFWDYLSEGHAVIWNDELSCYQEWDRFLSEQIQLATRASQSEMIVPPVKSLFGWDATFNKAVHQKTRFFLDRVELSTSESLELTPAEKSTHPSKGEPFIAPKHRVFIQGNADLTRGSKHSLGDLEPLLKLWMKQGFKTLVIASTQSQLERVRFLLQERNILCQQSLPPPASMITLVTGSLSEGFRWPAEGLVILTDKEILGSKNLKKNQRRSRSDNESAAKDWAGLQALSDLGVGDHIVHVDHGIGKYQGLVRLSLSGAPSDFLLLEYANRDRLYLPVYRLNVIQKYVGAGESITLDRLGSQQFAKTKDKVRDAVKKLAIDLVQLYAERKIRPGIQFSPRDSIYQEFEAQFPFEETPDQLKAIEAVLSDLESGQVMDRLVCGDVGYGKTEVAIRAAFKAVSDGKQVAVLVPTTILAQQHEMSFKARLTNYPIIIESISRFKSSKDQRILIEALAQGKIDIIIGTHRLLSKDVRFRDLGIVIVDEEHRFGVEHKERLKTLKINTHVLTLTATPIPRTLHMALSGLRNISLINTPPVDRLPIRTYVSKYDESLIQKAIEFELSRGGQTFFLHNRVQSIHETASRIRDLVPSARVVVAHGQMPESELEETMTAFYQKKVDVLVCTTIIESGLDLPSANTMIIGRADTLGLAQLYQIRGRVGRGQQRGYAYLLIPSEGALTEDAKRRLEVIQRFVELGSGFSIASHDLEIRGGGDLLGPQQSGNIAAVGFDLYTELLEEAIHELQGKPSSLEASHREPEIKSPFPAFLGEEYVPDVHQRLSLYRRFSGATQDSEVDQMEEELRDRFGNLPTEAQNLLWLIRIKILLKSMGIETLTVGPEKVSLLPGTKSRLDPIRAISLISAYPKRYQLMPDSKFVAQVPTQTLRDLFFGLEGLFKNLRTNSEAS
jgi:transcription-repair coupling factor (superfamily II helicase)